MGFWIKWIAFDLDSNLSWKLISWFFFRWSFICENYNVTAVIWARSCVLLIGCNELFKICCLDVCIIVWLYGFTSIPITQMQHLSYRPFDPLFLLPLLENKCTANKFWKVPFIKDLEGLNMSWCVNREK